MFLNGQTFISVHIYYNSWRHPNFSKLKALRGQAFKGTLLPSVKRHLCPSPELLSTVGLTSTRHNTGRWPFGALGQIHHNHSSVCLAFASLSALLSAAAPASPRRRKHGFMLQRKALTKQSTKNDRRKERIKG